MTDLTRRNLIMKLAMILPAAYVAPKLIVGKAHASSNSTANNASRGMSTHSAGRGTDSQTKTPDNKPSGHK